MPVGWPLQPHLRLRHIRRYVADEALHVLVEDVRGNTGLLQPVQNQVGVETIERDVEALHAPMSQARPRTSRPAQDVAAADDAREGIGTERSCELRRITDIPEREVRLHSDLEAATIGSAERPC